MVAGAAVSAIGASKAGSAGAALSKEEAQLIEDKAEFEESQFRRQAKKLLGSQRTAFAKGGVRLTGTGTATKVMSETAGDLEREALAIRHFGDSEAAARRLEGKAIKSAGAFGAATSILGTLGKID